MEVILPEFNIDFAQQMSDASKIILENNTIQNEADRAAIYTSLVACEIALKVALEYAGKPLTGIPKTHDVSKLLGLLCSCTVLAEVTQGKLTRVPASRVRGEVADRNYNNATIGNLLEAEKYGASKFPNEIRYGDTLKHYPAKVIQKLSSKLIAWVKLHADNIQA